MPKSDRRKSVAIEPSHPCGSNYHYVNKGTGARYQASRWGNSKTKWWELSHFVGLLGGVFPQYERVGNYPTLHAVEKAIALHAPTTCKSRVFK